MYCPRCGYPQHDTATSEASTPPHTYATIKLEATVTTHIEMRGLFRKKPKEVADETIPGAMILELTDLRTNEPLVRQTVAMFPLHLNRNLLGYGQIYDLGVNDYHKHAQWLHMRLEHTLNELAEQGWDVLPVLEDYNRYLPSQIALNAERAHSLSRELVQRPINHVLPYKI